MVGYATAALGLLLVLPATLRLALSPWSLVSWSFITDGPEALLAALGLGLLLAGTALAVAGTDRSA